MTIDKIIKQINNGYHLSENEIHQAFKELEKYGDILTNYYLTKTKNEK